MTVNPVFINELRQSAFRRRGTLSIVVMILGAILLTTLGRLAGLRNLVVFAPVVLLPLIVPAISSGAFAKEYEQHTWTDLYLTRLTNAQVVWGKFGAYFVQVTAALLVFAPSLVLMLLHDYSQRLSELRYAVVPLDWQIAAIVTTSAFLFKLLFSALLYIALTMVCSRYSPNRRTALTWSYIALGLYSGFGVLVWTLVGQLDYQVQALEAGAQPPSGRFVAAELVQPGFMESFHLLFCAIVGIGSFVLLWTSLSEQRGYRGNGGKEDITRAWQPISQGAAGRIT